MFNNMPFNPYMANPQMMSQNAYSGFQTGINQQPMNYTPQPQNSAPAVLYAPTAKDFASVSLQPGKQALIIAQNEPFLAFKNADNMGMVTTTIYRIEPVNEADLTPQQPEYVTRQEFQTFVDSLRQPVQPAQPTRASKKEVASE